MSILDDEDVLIKESILYTKFSDKKIKKKYFLDIYNSSLEDLFKKIFDVKTLDNKDFYREGTEIWDCNKFGYLFTIVREGIRKGEWYNFDNKLYKANKIMYKISFLCLVDNISDETPDCYKTVEYIQIVNKYKEKFKEYFKFYEMCECERNFEWSKEVNGVREMIKKKNGMQVEIIF